MSVYAISDLHGYYKIYEQVNNFIKPDDKVICLGDCGDRGPQPWKTIKAVLTNPQWTYLKGNHEDMLVKAVMEYTNADSYTNDALSLLYWNSGERTFCECMEDDEKRSLYINELKKLPQYVIYCNSKSTIYLSHAGCTPPVNTEDITENNFLWNRNHFFDKWDEEKYPNLVFVHGHTPLWSIDRSLPLKAYWYANGHKVNIDLGGFRTGKFCLLNLDTYEEHIFEA